MKLLVHELKTELVQNSRGDKHNILEAIRLHLYKHNSPSGNLFVEVRDLNNQLVSRSEILPISSISEAPFFHGQVRFYVNAYLIAGNEYRIALCASEYTFNESAYIGWCADFDFKTYPRQTEILMDSPLDYEIWERRQGK